MLLLLVMVLLQPMVGVVVVDRGILQALLTRAAVLFMEGLLARVAEVSLPLTQNPQVKRGGV